MKKRLLATLVLVTSSSFALAGGSDRFISQLNLDDSQSSEVQRIFSEGKAQRKAIRQEAKEKINALNAAQKEELSTILDAEQMTVIEEKMDKMNNRKGKRAHGKKAQDA